MLTYGDTNISYGMTAQYSPDSAEDPIILVKSNYEGENTSYEIHVNEVDPRNASELEIFALLSYADEQGMLDTGDFGSYHNMKIYAENARLNGYWQGNLDSFSIKFIDFKNIQWENRTGDTFLKYQELELPQEVKAAWFETVGEQKDMQESDFYAQVSSGMRRRVKELLSGENRQADTWEDSVSAALNAAKDELQDLEYNLVPELKKDADIQEEIRKQRAFYQAFIDKLNMLLEESTEVETTESISQESISVETDQEELLTYEEMIAQKIEELFTKIENGETAPSFQIGNQEFTLEEWEKFLEEFDSVEEAVRELMKEQQERQTEKTENLEVYFAARSEDEPSVDLLTAESTRCSYPRNDPEEEDTVYFTWYTTDGIYCKKSGEEEFEWTISLENEEDYDKVMEYLQQFEGCDNLRFGCHENFWNDFLSGELDQEAFLEFFQGTNNGIPNYGIIVGDSVYIDKEKAQWAKYMNSPNFFTSYTEEEMRQIQEERMTRNIL